MKDKLFSIFSIVTFSGTIVCSILFVALYFIPFEKAIEGPGDFDSGEKFIKIHKSSAEPFYVTSVSVAYARNYLDYLFFLIRYKTTDVKIIEDELSFNNQQLKTFTSTEKEFKNYVSKKIHSKREREVFLANLAETVNFYTEPQTDISKIYKKEEFIGGSAGLMMSLHLIQELSKKDLTKGKIIAGTGTIEEQGFIGPIAGAKYKFIVAHRNKADVFFVPQGSNYEEVIRESKKLNSKVKIISISHIQEALDYLKYNQFE